MKTQAELIALIPRDVDCEITNSRMKQLFSLLSNCKISEPDLRFFEAEILTYIKKRESAALRWLKYRERQAQNYL